LKRYKNIFVNGPGSGFQIGCLNWGIFIYSLTVFPYKTGGTGGFISSL